MSQWDGRERRQKHVEILPECKQIFIRIEEKIDTLVMNTKAINGRYQKHLEESVPYRGKVDVHERILLDNSIYKKQIITVLVSIIFTILLQIIGFSYLFGGINKQVDINTSRWEKLSTDAHPEIK